MRTSSTGRSGPARARAVDRATTALHDIEELEGGLMARKRHCRFGVARRGRRKGQCLKNKRHRKKRGWALARAIYGGR